MFVSETWLEIRLPIATNFEVDEKHFVFIATDYVTLSFPFPI